MLLPTGTVDGWLDIGQGLRLGAVRREVWAVSGANGISELKADADYFRVVLLLERPYTEVVSAISRFAEVQDMRVPFRYVAVVKAGIGARVDHWAASALGWLLELPLSDRRDLARELQELSVGKWASQQVRQIAARESKRLAKELRS